MTDLIFVVVGMLAWLGIMLLFGEWLLPRREPVDHQGSSDELPWIASSDDSAPTKPRQSHRHAGSRESN